SLNSSFVYHLILLFSTYLQIDTYAEVEHPLQRIPQSQSGHLRIPQFEPRPVREVGTAQVDPHIAHVSPLGQVLRQGITHFRLLQTNERTITQPPGTPLIIISNIVLR